MPLTRKTRNKRSRVPKRRRANPKQPAEPPQSPLETTEGDKDDEQCDIIDPARQASTAPNEPLVIGSPISRLPVETLCHIFGYCTESSSRPCGRLVLVCRLWYHIVINHRRLWINLDVGNIGYLSYREFRALGGLDTELRFIDTCHERSGSLALDVTFDVEKFWSIFVSTTDRHVEKAYQLLFSLLQELLTRDIARWRSFRYSCHENLELRQRVVNFDNDVFKAIEEKGTRLDTLDLHDPWTDFYSWSWLWKDKHLTNLTNLKSLTIHGFYYYLGGNAQLSHLTQLHVTWVREDDWPCSNNNWLRMFPQLEDLTLNQQNDLDIYRYFRRSTFNANDYLDADRPPLPVPSVKKLHLIGSLSVDFLATLHFPSLESLVIENGRLGGECLEAAGKLPFAKATKSLLLINSTNLFEVCVWNLDKVAKLLSALPNLGPTFLVNHQMRIRCELMGNPARGVPMKTELHGETIEGEEIDVQRFLDGIRNVEYPPEPTLIILAMRHL